VDRFVTVSEALATSANAYAAAAKSDPSADRAAVQTAWIDAMGVWQELELMSVGPAGSSLDVVAGQDLRDETYSWPTTNRCRVDQVTVTEDWESASFYDDYLVNTYGLDAMEFLLFPTDTANSCLPQQSINADGTWDALGEDGVLQLRAAYAAAIAEGVATQAKALQSAWTESFAADLAGAGGADSSFGTQEEALDALYAAMFYLETQSKDDKLGIPLGIIPCPSGTCSDTVEAPLAGQSHAFIAANLTGFRTLFTGADGAGFDDLLVDLGHGDLTDEVLAKLDAADAAAAAVSGPLDEAPAAETQALYDSLKDIADLLKGDLATVLMLTVPQEAAGDND